jgi:flagellar FliL protein
MATTKNPTLPTRSTLPMRTGGSSRFLRPIIGLLVLLIVAAASVATTWMITTRSQRTAANSAVQINVGQPQPPTGATPTTFVAAPAVPQAVPAPIFIPITPFTVTVQSPDRERIVHIAMTLRVADEQSRQRIEKYMPEVRSRVLMLLSAQTPENVQTPQGKVDLAAAILKTVNRPFTPLPDGQYVTDVLFTEFVVQ